MYTIETVSKMTVQEALQLGVQRFRDGFTFAKYNIRPTGFVTACFKAKRTDFLKALDHLDAFTLPIIVPSSSTTGSARLAICQP